MSLQQYAAYQNQSGECMPRADLILALFEETIRKLEQARDALQRRDRAAAKPLLNRALLLVGGLASGVIPDAGELANNCLRLYEFALHRIQAETLVGVEDALRALRPLQEGFQGIRDEAVELERNGVIPVLAGVTFEASA